MYRVIRVRLINLPEVTQLVIVLLEYEPWKCGPLPALYEYAYYPTTSTILGSDGVIYAGSIEMFMSGLHFQILARREGQTLSLESLNMENSVFSVVSRHCYTF